MFKKKVTEPKPPRNNHKIPFSWQRAIIAFGLQTGVTLYSNAVMWNHIDSFGSKYGFWMKAGLIGIVDFAGYWLVIMHLYGKAPLTRFYAIFTATLLMVVVLIHAGAIGKYEASKTENIQQVNNIGNNLAVIAAAEIKAKTEANAQAAMAANAAGQTRLARRLSTQSTGSSSEAQKNLLQVAQGKQPESFLPQWYLDGAMYWALMVLAGVMLIGLLVVTENVIHIEDANHNGVPDALEFGRTQQAAPIQAYTLPAPRPAIGFNTNVNPNHQYGQPAPKELPR